MGILGQVVGADGEKIAPVLCKVLGRQAGRGDAEHHAKGGILVERHPPLPQAAAAVLHHLHGGVPILDIGDHGQHDPQRPPGGRPEQGADLGLELVGLAQAAADAPQPQFGGLHPPVGVRYGAVGAKVKGAHGHRLALGRSQAGYVKEILLLLVQNAPRQHHVAAAQQAHALGAGLHGGVDVLGAKAVGHQLKRFAARGQVGPGPQLPQAQILPLQLTDADHGLLVCGGVRVQHTLALGGIQDQGAAVAVVQKIPSYLHHAGDVHGPGNDGCMALAAAFGGDDAQDHAGRHAEQVAGHQDIRSQDHGMVQRQPDPGPVAQDVQHTAGGIQHIHAAQLHIGVVGHVCQLVRIAVAHPADGRRRPNARSDVGADLFHKALVLQQHALEQKDSLLGGGRTLGHGFQLGLGGVDGVGQHLLLPVGIERAVFKGLHMTLQPADLAHYQAGRSGNTLVDPHAFVTSVILGGAGGGRVSARYTIACKNVLGATAARAARAALPWPSSSGKNTRMRP